MLCARLRSNRVFYGAPAPKPPGMPGQPREHGTPVRCDDETTWAGPSITGQARHAAGTAPCRSRRGTGCTPSCAKDGGWARHPGKIPVIEGTLIQLRPARLPGYRELKPMWLRASVTGAGEPEITVLWQAFLRRFDLEHAFRFFKQVLGWDAPLLRDPAAADRWTWLIIAALTAQLRLARPLAADLRLPWQRPQPPGTMTPARVRRGFRCRPRHSRHSRSPAQTRQARPRTPEGIQEPAQSTQLRRRQAPP